MDFDDKCHLMIAKFCTISPDFLFIYKIFGFSFGIKKEKKKSLFKAGVQPSSHYLALIMYVRSISLS